jgi:very-short-patch-repair endonuclease
MSSAASVSQNVKKGLQRAARDRRAMALAKSLRRRLTGPEAKLWSQLERIQTIDTHFRKQSAFDHYVLDFVCHRAKLVIEVDGNQHGHGGQEARDKERDGFLAACGYRTLRFSNLEVLQEMEAVLDTIYAELHGDGAPPSHSKKRRLQNEAPSSPSTGEVARRAGGGDRGAGNGEAV